MRKKNISFIKDRNMIELVEGIFNENLGEPIAFTSAPSLTDMEANSWGFHSTSLYIKYKDGTGVVFTGIAMT